MRWLVLSTAVIGLAAAAEAREPLARPMERTPSIMVGGETAKKVTPAQKRQAAKRQPSRTTRAQASRTRPVILPRGSAVYEAETGALNRSISQQQRQLQSEQRQQIDNSLFRQEIQRSSPSIGCTPGSLGC